MQHLKILVSGEVQGVFFRQTTKQVADAMKLSGTVKNLPTGDVEIHISGNEADAHTLIERVRHELSTGEITSYSLHKQAETSSFEGFSIL